MGFIPLSINPLHFNRNLHPKYLYIHSLLWPTNVNIKTKF